ncbi:MAG TPA: phosphoglucomutase/phosphomannomutase family protein [Candidatus Polarisedimenticolia bacterium]|nr:phosphoglucomutase/phosphomannomutase family protein [Candidatus Polarisedimenticolia bacterium]
MPIRFGTDGWRGVIADDFTFANVRRVAAAADRAFRERGDRPDPGRPVVVGYDTRFLSRAFAQAAAGVLAAAGRRVLLSGAPCPTPAVSCQVVERRSPFGVVLTASHNPASFNGFKIKDGFGSSAGGDVTAACERHLEDGDPECLAPGEAARRGLLEEGSFEEAHAARLGAMVDLASIRAAGLRVVVDPMHGSSGRLLERLLAGGATRVATLRAEADPLFGGCHPEPLERNLDGLRDAIASWSADAGLATDGDGDRIGAFDETGRFVSPLRIAPLLAWSLIKKGRRGPLGKTFANTILLDRIARRYGLPFTAFPVGFKHIARELQQGRMLLGGEESGGIGVEGYLPERDGAMVSLLLLQAMVDEGKPLSRLVSELTASFGELEYARRDLELPPERGRALVDRLRASPPASLGGMTVTGQDDLDGLKLLFGEEGWILFRASGTEPVLRVYCEVPGVDAAARVMSEAVRLVAGPADLRS